MLKKSGIRLIGLNILLVSLMIQGLMPDGHTVVSPFAFRWLDSLVASDDGGAAHGRSPGKNRPAPNAAEGSFEEVVLPGEPHAPTVLRRRLADTTALALTSIGPSEPCARHEPPPSGRFDRPTHPLSDPISSLCRLSC